MLRKIPKKKTKALPISYFRLLVRFLSDEAKRSVRATSKAGHREICNAEWPPYKTKTSFAIGVANIFFDKTHFNLSWEIYNFTLLSEANMPAVLYKLKDLKSLEAYHPIFQNPDSKVEGQIYCPAQLEVTASGNVELKNYHEWSMNQVWVMAQSHLGRAFCIVSDLTFENLYRRDFKNVPSAFAKEIYCAVKAGYHPCLIDDKPGLMPPRDGDAPLLRFQDFDSDNTLSVVGVYKLGMRFAAMNKSTSTSPALPSSHSPTGPGH